MLPLWRQGSKSKCLLAQRQSLSELQKKRHLERVCRSKQKTEQKPPLKPTPKSKSEAKAHNVAAVDAEWDQDHGEYYLNAINAIGGDTPRIRVTPKINAGQLQRVPAQGRKRGVNHVLTRQISSPGTGTDVC